MFKNLKYIKEEKMMEMNLYQNLTISIEKLMILDNKRESFIITQS
jgi:hypothetical protein